MIEMRDDDLERGLDELGDGGGPPQGWQDRVLARITEAPAELRRWPLVVFASGVVAATAALVLVAALRQPPSPSSPADNPPAVAEPREPDALKIETNAPEIPGVEPAELDELEKRRRKARKAWPKRDDGKYTAACDPNDPLCGLE